MANSINPDEDGSLHVSSRSTLFTQVSVLVCPGEGVKLYTTAWYRGDALYTFFPHGFEWNTSAGLPWEALSQTRMSHRFLGNQINIKTSVEQSSYRYFLCEIRTSRVLTR